MFLLLLHTISQSPTNCILWSFLVFFRLCLRSTSQFTTASPSQIFEFTTASPSQIFDILSVIDNLVVVLIFVRDFVSPENCGLTTSCGLRKSLKLCRSIFTRYTYVVYPENINTPEIYISLPPELPFSFRMTYPTRYVSDTDTDVESEYEVDEEYADIEHVEQGFEETDKVDGHYYLGIPFTVRALNQTVMNCSISASTFLSKDYSRVVAYLGNIASFLVYSDYQVEILQLHISDHGEYNVVVKTVWLRLVQRRWKTILRLRREIIAKRASVQNQLYFQLHGQYLPGTRVIPGLLGMMSFLYKTLQRNPEAKL